MQVSALYRYPLKSAQGHALERAEVDRFGLVGDRRWMLVDDSGRFFSQRRLPRMALLRVLVTANGLQLGFGDETREVLQPDPRGERVIASVWEDTVVAPLADAQTNAWLSDCFGESMRLVYYPDDALRGVEPGYAPTSQLVAFADGFPLLIVTEASLELLNSKLAAPVPMDRFRPNLVIAGSTPHAEDGWTSLRVGTTPLKLVKPCSRCAVPSIDQRSAKFDPEINRVLAQYRRQNGVIYFGMNGIAPAGATFCVGDAVEVCA